MPDEAQDAHTDLSAAENADQTGRRHVLGRFASFLMVSGLAAGYGMFAALIGRFLYPNRDFSGVWQFVTDLGGFPVGKSLLFRSPSGQQVVISRLKDTGTADDFIALSSVCPHLGCQVHWESQNDRFFCPCHNGAFDAEGQPLSGPPKDDNQPLLQFPLKIENNLLFIQAGTERLT